MYRDRKGRTFEDIIQLCRQHKIKLNLTTNGSFYSPQGHSGTQLSFNDRYHLLSICSHGMGTSSCTCSQ